MRAVTRISARWTGVGPWREHDAVLARGQVEPHRSQTGIGETTAGTPPNVTVDPGS